MDFFEKKFCDISELSWTWDWASRSVRPTDSATSWGWSATHKWVSLTQLWASAVPDSLLFLDENPENLIFRWNFNFVDLNFKHTHIYIYVCMCRKGLMPYIYIIYISYIIWKRGMIWYHTIVQNCNLDLIQKVDWPMECRQRIAIRHLYICMQKKEKLSQLISDMMDHQHSKNIPRLVSISITSIYQVSVFAMLTTDNNTVYHFPLHIDMIYFLKNIYNWYYELEYICTIYQILTSNDSFKLKSIGRYISVDHQHWLNVVGALRCDSHMAVKSETVNPWAMRSSWKSQYRIGMAHGAAAMGWRFHFLLQPLGI